MPRFFASRSLQKVILPRLNQLRRWPESGYNSSGGGSFGFLHASEAPPASYDCFFSFSEAIECPIRLSACRFIIRGFPIATDRRLHVGEELPLRQRPDEFNTVVNDDLRDASHRVAAGQVREL